MRVGTLVKWKHEDPFWVSLGTVVELRHSDIAEKGEQFRVVWHDDLADVEDYKGVWYDPVDWKSSMEAVSENR